MLHVFTYDSSEWVHLIYRKYPNQRQQPVLIDGVGSYSDLIRVDQTGYCDYGTWYKLEEIFLGASEDQDAVVEAAYRVVFKWICTSIHYNMETFYFLRKVDNSATRLQYDGPSLVVSGKPTIYYY